MTETSTDALGRARVHKTIPVPVGTPITIGEAGGATIGHEEPFVFAGVEFFSSDSGLEADWVTPTAGSCTFVVTTLDNPQFTDAITVPTVDATAPELVSWEGPTKRVTVTATGVTGATHWRLNLRALRP